MARWLLKTDPDDYPFATLLHDRRTVWDGVKNALAQRHLRAMRRGDSLLVYETGSCRALVGTAKVVGTPRPETNDPAGKRVEVEISAGKRLARTVPLAEIKADPAFRDFALVRIGRLSVMPVTDDQWRRLLELAGD